MAIPAPFSPKDIPANFDPNFEQNSTDQFGQSPVFEASVPQSVEQNLASRLEQNFAETSSGKSPAGFEPDLSGFGELNAEVFGLLGQDKEGVDPGVLAPASPIREVPDQEQDQLEPHSGPEMLVSTVTGKSSSMEQSLCNEFRP